MQKRINVSIIFVVYNGETKRLLSSLASVYQYKPKVSFEIRVVNNGTEDIAPLLKKKYPKVHYIKSKTNLGYGGGNNLGTKNASGKYLFIFNNDTKLLKNTLDILVSYIEKHPDVAMVAPNLVDAHGVPFERTGTRILTPIRGIVALSFLNVLFPKNPISKKYYMDDVPNSVIRETDSVPGAAFLIQADIFKKVGMFDENIFLFNEEQDLGKRIRDSNYKIVMIPEATVYHTWTHQKKHEGIYETYAHNSRFYYFKKHYGLFWALGVESFARFSKRKALIAVAILLAVLLLYI